MALARKRLGVKVVITTGVGGGFVDLVLGWRGMTILAEVKRPKKKLDPDQVTFRDTWPGGPIIMADSAEDLVVKLIMLDREYGGAGRLSRDLISLLSACYERMAEMGMPGATPENLAGLLGELRKCLT